MESDQDVFVTAVAHLSTTVVVAQHPVKVFVDIGRVDAKEIAVLGHAVHDDIVHNTATRVAQDRVLRLPEPHPSDIGDQQFLTHFEGPRAGHLDLSHVAEVEQPGSGANRLVLGQDATLVLHRHLPTAELDHACAQGAVCLVKRGALGHKEAFSKNEVIGGR